jgi:hypothetical protein
MLGGLLLIGPTSIIRKEKKGKGGVLVIYWLVVLKPKFVRVLTMAKFVFKIFCISIYLNMEV